MKTKFVLSAILAAAALSVCAAKKAAPAISGDYLEVRSCDVYTGACFANAEMGLAGREGMMVWRIQQGNWQGTSLDGLSVIAVVRTDASMGDLRYQPRQGKAVLIVDQKANVRQKEALASFARKMSGQLTAEVIETKTAPISVNVGGCSAGGCATVKAAGLVDISTRCLGGKDHVCGNEETFYPPLTAVSAAAPVYTEVAAYRGTGLDLTWQISGTRGAFLGTFAQ
jgi:hypothetical protein